MNCDEFKARLHDYFHGSLDAQRATQVDRHAETCSACGALMKLAKEISCRDFVTFLNQYVDGELSPERRAVFDRHLAICPDCTAYIDSYRKTMRLASLSMRNTHVLPEGVPEDLVKAIVAARKKP
jgi:anti-sigma factor RsiW